MNTSYFKKSILGIALALVSISFAQNPRIYKTPEFAKTWSHPSAHPDHIVLNYGEDASTQMAVSWRTDTTVTKGFTEIAMTTASPKFWRHAKTLEADTQVMDASEIKTAEIISHYHTVKFDSLIPDSKYAYRVGDGNKWSEWIHFKTASNKKDKPFSFLYVGDAQNYILEVWSRLIREGYRTAPDASFIIHAGDLVNDGHNEQQWHEWFSAGGWIHSMLPSIPVLGNHEYRPYNIEDSERGIRRRSVQWRPQFNLPLNGPESMHEEVYYTDYQDIRIITLNTLGDKMLQKEWLETVLQNNPQKWTIVTYHHPFYSASRGRDNKNLRELWKPLFDKYKVDLSLQGHDHGYARGRVAPSGENVVDGVNLLDETGTVYVVSVSGGKMYGLGDGWDEFGAKRNRGAENTQLFQVISIDNDTLIYESYTATGELYDKFELQKQPDGKPNLFKELKNEAIAPRRFNNTIAYRDFIPDDILSKVNETFPGYKVDNVKHLGDNENFKGYMLEIYKDKHYIFLTLDTKGNVIKKKSFTK